MARHWAEVGFGTPIVLHLFYVIKICLYILGGWLFALTTKGIDGFTAVGSWWSEPIVFQKVVLYTLLFEVIGLGCGFGPLNNRFPPNGLNSLLVAAKDNSAFAVARLRPADEGHQPYAGGRRALCGVTGHDCGGPCLRWHWPYRRATHHGRCVLTAWHIWTVLGLLAVLGLRDKVIFLAARGEVYATLAVTFLFTGGDMIIASKIVFLVIWLGAATSKLNRHFPFVVSTMLANSPILRPRCIKRRFFKRFPDDLRPGRLSQFLAHGGAAVEMIAPLVLFFSHGGWPTAAAALVMVCFHLATLSAIPMGVPLEWNVFMVFGVLALFVAHAVADMVTRQPWDDDVPVHVYSNDHAS